MAMYSVIECGGFQHKVTVGERVKLTLPKLEAKIGEIITAPKVLLFSNGANVKVGAPVVDGASVKMEVLGHDREDKVLIFKRKRRKRYRLLKGHRQHYTEVLVTEIACGSDKSTADEQAKVRARARSKALAAAKVQNVPPTRKQKIPAAAKG